MLRKGENIGIILEGGFQKHCKLKCIVKPKKKTFSEYNLAWQETGRSP